MARIVGTLAEELARFVSRSTRDGGCLMGPQRGYGWIAYEGGGRISAHRAAHIVHIGPIPAGMVVRHRCDRPGCIEPTHLSLGTVADNNRDAKERGRAAAGARHPGVRHGSEVVAAAVAEYLAGGRSQAEVARRYGISQVQLGRWVRAEYRRDGGQAGYRQGKGRSALARGGLKPCGTKAAYERHVVASEEPCAACRQAHRDYMAAYRAKRRRERATSPPL